MSRMRYFSLLLRSSTLAAMFISKAGAATLCVAIYCDLPFIPPTEVVQPIQGPLVSPLLLVVQQFPFQNSNGWNYFFYAEATDIASVSIPYFEGWDLSQITPTDGWSYQVINATENTLAPLARWEPNNGKPFGYYSVNNQFVSSFAPTLVNIDIRNAFGNIVEAQVYLPLTPSAIAAGYFEASLPVPEPSGALLLASGIGILLSVRRNSCAKIAS